MAGGNKLHKNDQPSIKYRWYPVGQASSGLPGFVHEESAPAISDKVNKQCSRKLQPKPREILSTAELIAAVGQIWDCASRPLGFFQPKAHSNQNDGSCQKEVFLADIGGEGNDTAPISAKSEYLSVDFRNFGPFPPAIQSSLDFLQVSEKISVFEPCSRSCSHSSFWRFLHDGASVSQESWRGNGLASLEVSYQLGSIYGWMGDMISSGLNCPVKVTEIDNRTGQYCIPGETVSIAGRSISGDTTSHSEKLAANAENPAVIECYKYHLSSYENGNLELDRSTSLSSDYFLSSVGSVADGALSGVFVSICLHPVDTIKTVVQSCRAEQKSIYDIGKSIVSDRGLTGLYRGIATNIASSAPISAVYTFTYESVKGALLPLFPTEYYSFAHCVAGGCASIATSFIFTPSERIKQQMQVGSHYHSCWNAFVGIIRKGGLPSLYAGWGAVLCRNVPHSIVKFYTYESLKQFMLSPKEAGVQPTTLQTLVCGGIAGSTAALFTTPFDVVKTRLQTQIPGSMSQYNGVIHALQEIGKSEGLQGLYRGLTPRLIMYMSQGAIFFASYEFFKRLFSLESPQTDVQRIQYKQNMDNDPVLPSSIPSPSSQASSELHAQHS